MRTPAHLFSKMLLGACLLLPAFAASAQQLPERATDQGAADPELVIARTVQPRIAYRGLEPTDNPVRNAALLFPARVFHNTLGGALDVAMDAELGATRTASEVVVGSTRDLTGRALSAVMPGAAGTGNLHLGAGLGAGAGSGTMGGGGIAGTVNGAIGTAMQAMPRTGGGP